MAYVANEEITIILKALHGALEDQLPSKVGTRSSVPSRYEKRLQRLHRAALRATTEHSGVSSQMAYAYLIGYLAAFGWDSKSWDHSDKLDLMRSVFTFASEDMTIYGYVSLLDGYLRVCYQHCTQW